MIEPTESPSKSELDAFIEAMVEAHRESQSAPEILTGAPRHSKVGRLDETRAARTPIPRWSEERVGEAKGPGCALL